MNFQHKLLPRLTIPSKMDGNDRIYITPEGEFYSVTTRLRKYFGSKALDEWKERIGEDEANQVSHQAKVRGIAVHKLAENYLLNNNNLNKGAMPTNLLLFNSIKKLLNDNIDTVYGCELPIYSSFLKCGGCTDVVARWGKYRSIIDFKTSKKIKKENWVEQYLLQTTAYSIMMEERYKMSFPQIIVIILVDHEEPQLFVRMREEYQDKIVSIFS